MNSSIYILGIPLDDNAFRTFRLTKKRISKKEEVLRGEKVYVSQGFLISGLGKPNIYHDLVDISFGYHF